MVLAKFSGYRVVTDIILSVAKNSLSSMGIASATIFKSINKLWVRGGVSLVFSIMKAFNNFSRAKWHRHIVGFYTLLEPSQNHIPIGLTIQSSQPA
jgi:hypothetical protein